MKKLLLALIAVLALASAAALWARPFSIKCPRDGESMWFDHQVGYGRDSYCWYSHSTWDSNAGGMVKHEAYIPCE